MSTDMKIAKEPTGPLEDFVIEDPYEAWQQREGVRAIRDFAFEDLNAIELTPWARKGGKGAIINIPNEHLPSDAHLVEIAPGGRSEPERHLYEETVYVLAGRGATSVWLDERHKQTFEWQPGSLFSIPLNATYQHFNASGDTPARYIAITNAPPMMRLFNDDDFIFNNPFRFGSRYEGDGHYFRSGKLFRRKQRRVWKSNFIPNAPDLALFGLASRGAGGINIGLDLAENSTKAHISEFPVGTYKKGHRHGPGAHLLILSGVGFSLLWTKEDLSDLRKVDWRAGGMVIVPSDACFHQHFNTGPTRARYLALRSGPHGLMPRVTVGSDVSLKEGGWQIEYEDEDRRVHEVFEAELARHGVACRMKAFIPWCHGEADGAD